MKYWLLVCGLVLIVQDGCLGDSSEESFRRISAEDDRSESKNLKSLVKHHSLRRKNSHKKKSGKDIWNWDYWCQMQPKRGNCTGNITKYYYDAQLDQCMTFQFSGCNGNNNMFETALKCMARCRGSTYNGNVLRAANRTVFCSLQPSSGMCLGMFSMFYYDINEKICKTFMYGGCGGNQNRFETFSECTLGCEDV